MWVKYIRKFQYTSTTTKICQKLSVSPLRCTNSLKWLKFWNIHGEVRRPWHSQVVDTISAKHLTFSSNMEPRACTYCRSAVSQAEGWAISTSCCPIIMYRRVSFGTLSNGYTVFHAQSKLLDSTRISLPVMLCFFEVPHPWVLFSLGNDSSQSAFSFLATLVKRCTVKFTKD